MFMSQANVNSLVDRDRLVGQYFITDGQGLEEGNNGPTRQDRPKRSQKIEGRITIQTILNSRLAASV